MTLVENECTGAPQPTRQYELKRWDPVEEPINDVTPDPWFVALAFGGGALFGIAFWGFVIWLCL